MREFDPLISEVNIIHSDRELEEDEQIKIGYEKDGVNPQISRDYLNVFEKLTIKDFTQDQRKKFENIKEVERLHKKAMAESVIKKKLEYIQNAIDLAPENKDLFLLRANIYEELENLDDVIKDCEKVIHELDTSNIKAYELLGRTQIKLNNYQQAKWAFEQILSFNGTHIGAKLGLAEILFLEKDYNQALKTYNEIIKLDGENAKAYIGRANVEIIANNYLSANEDVYQALLYDTEYVAAYTTLAEINALLSNKNEFYLNLERALKIDVKWVETFMRNKKLQELFINDKRFERLVEKYDLHLDFVD